MPIKEPLRSVCKKTFYDEHVDITGCRIEDCVFDGCVVERWKLPLPMGTVSIRNKFEYCMLVGNGRPPTIKTATTKGRSLNDGRLVYGVPRAIDRNSPCPPNSSRPSPRRPSSES